MKRELKDLNGQPISKNDLQSVLNTMIKLKVEKGYMDYIEKNGEYKLTFFMIDPNFRTNRAFKITQKKLLKWLLA